MKSFFDLSGFFLYKQDMAEAGQGQDALRGLTRVPREYKQTVLSPSGKPESVDIVRAYAEYKRPEGTVVRRVHG